MTSKDLAEMTLGFGLACQKYVRLLFISALTHVSISVSTASQAITTYIRNHLSHSSDYSHVHIASGDDDGIGIAVDVVAKVLAGENTTSSFAGRAPIDQTRWSEYSLASDRGLHINT